MDFPPHVRAGNDEHAPARIELYIIRDKRLVKNILNNQVTAFFNGDAGSLNERRTAQFQRDAAFGEVGEHVQFREGVGAQSQHLDMSGKVFEQTIIERLFQ